MAETARKQDWQWDSYEEFLRLSAGETLTGWEFLDGEIIKMEAPGPVHQEILMELGRQIANYLRGKTCRVFPAPFDVELGEDSRGDPIVVQPDLSVICDPKKITGRNCQGAPDLIVEIASPSTRSRDRITKLNLYRRYGVKEYWMVNPETQDVDVLIFGDGDPCIFTCYNRTQKIQVHVLEGCEIDLSEVFPQPEESGTV